MARLALSAERCKGCELCVKSCPRGVLRLTDKVNDQGYRVVEMVEGSDCTGCGVCYTVCPDVAIEIYEGDETDGKGDRTG